MVGRFLVSNVASEKQKIIPTDSMTQISSSWENSVGGSHKTLCRMIPDFSRGRFCQDDICFLWCHLLEKFNTCQLLQKFPEWCMPLKNGPWAPEGGNMAPASRKGGNCFREAIVFHQPQNCLESNFLCHPQQRMGDHHQSSSSCFFINPPFKTNIVNLRNVLQKGKKQQSSRPSILRVLS